MLQLMEPGADGSIGPAVLSISRVERGPMTPGLAIALTPPHSTEASTAPEGPRR